MKDAAALAILCLILLGAWIWSYPQDARQTYEILTGGPND